MDYSLTRETEETFELNSEQEIQLLAAIAEAERGELISLFDLLKTIRAET